MNQTSAQPAAHHQVMITVNTKPFDVAKEEISYEEIVGLAFGAVPPGENVAFTVTYRRGHGNKPSGSLVEGATCQGQGRHDLQRHQDRQVLIAALFRGVMSQSIITASADLSRLQQEGYELELSSSGHLMLGHVPYVTPQREVAYGRLVTNLEMAGNVTVRPSDHVVFFAGDTPCDRDGRPLTRIINSTGRQQLAPGLEVDHTFSSKPPQGYADYFEKMTTYVSLLAGPAQALDPNATAQTYSVVVPGDVPTVFRYLDTASGRAGVADLADRLAQPRVAIVGLGGTGAYILDLVAKTPVKEIHLFDGDIFLQHNAFRAPGAASAEDLAARSNKAQRLAGIYDRMRTGVIAHPYALDEHTVAELDEMSFVFMAIDDGPAKRLIMDRLHAAGTAFIDVGMGVWRAEAGLGGSLRVTTSTPQHRAAGQRIDVTARADDDYDTNIQIADLNALNAALAVIRWKKLCGFYADLEHEHHAVYEIDGNAVVNEGRQP